MCITRGHVDPDGGGPFGEQHDRIGHRQRRHGDLHLPGDRQCFATGRQHPQPTRSLQEPPHRVRRRIRHLLAVVEDEQDTTRCQPCDQLLEGRVGIEEGEVERVSHRCGDAGAGTHLAQCHEPRPIGVVTGHLPGERQGQRRLARAAGPHESQQSVGG